MGTFSRSWEITKMSFGVLRKDKELLLFPLFAGIFSILFIIAMIWPIAISATFNIDTVNQFTLYAIIFGIYFGLALITIFFNVCTVYTIKKRFSGGDSTFMEAIRFAFSRFHLIVGWSIISATVGLVLRILDGIAERMEGIGQIMMNIMIFLMGAAWSMITLFVVPAMVYDNVGPITAIKKSVNALKKTWGETLVREIGLGLVEFVLIILGIVGGLLLAFLVAPLGITAIVVVVALVVIYLIAVVLLFSVMNAVFNTALYEYAEKGKVPTVFDEKTIKATFRSKKKPTI